MISTKRESIIFFCVCIGISFLLYGKTLFAAFVYDDSFYIQNPASWQQVVSVYTQPLFTNAQQSGLYRPFSSSLFELSLLVFGKTALPLRIVIIMFNAFVAWALYLLLKKLYGRGVLPVIIAFLFLILPIHSEAVGNNKNGLEEVLGVVFLLSSLFVFLKSIQTQKNQISLRLITAVLFLLAVLCKELFIVSILLLPLILLYSNSNIKKHTMNTFITLSTVSIAYVFIRYLILGQYAFGNDIIDSVANPLKNASVQTVLFSFFAILSRYVIATLFPFTLSATYHANHFLPVSSLMSPYTLGGIAIAIVFTLCVFIPRIRKTPLGLGSLWFIITYIPISQLFVQGGDAIAERWMYLPSAGILITLGYLLTFLISKYKILGYALVGIICILYASVTFIRSSVWISNEKLFTSMIHDAPDSIQGYYALSQEYYIQGKLPQASRVIEEGKKLNIEYPPFLNTAGAIAFKNGNVQEAEALYLRSKQKDPSLASTTLALASIYYATGQYDKALPMFLDNLEKSKIIEPQYVLYTAATYAKLGQKEVAQQLVNKYRLHQLKNPQIEKVLQQLSL